MAESTILAVGDFPLVPLVEHTVSLRGPRLLHVGIAGVTDSFGPPLAGMRDGLGFLAGSACPHYDGEGLRRPVCRASGADGETPLVARQLSQAS